MTSLLGCISVSFQFPASSFQPSLAEANQSRATVGKPGEGCRAEATQWQRRTRTRAPRIPHRGSRTADRGSRHAAESDFTSAFPFLHAVCCASGVDSLGLSVSYLIL